MRPFALIAVLLLVGCPKMVVRQGDVYEAEVAWNQAAMAQAAELLKEGATERLEAGNPAGCVKMAEVALVLEARAPWHSAMSLHLADLGKHPGDPPPVPSSDTLCPTPSPQRLPEKKR